MKIFQDPKTLPKKFRRAGVCIGVFDGVHLGHRALIRAMRAYCIKNKAPLGVITFYPHPRRVLRGERDFEEIITFEQKMTLFARLGVEFVAVFTFDRAFASRTAGYFVRHSLAALLGIRALFVGNDFVMGCDKKHARDFKRLCEKEHIIVRTVPLFKKRGSCVTSTSIRRFIKEGRMQEAELLLGRKLFMQGSCVPGKGLGRKIGLPTLNIRFSHALIPRAAVYSCQVRIDGRTFKGALYIGKSFAQTRNERLFYPQKQTADAEVYVFNFDAHRYAHARKIAVRPVRFLRPPKTFTTLGIFQRQAAEDIATIQRNVA